MYLTIFNHRLTDRGVEQWLTFRKLDPANIEKAAARAREILATMPPDDPERSAVEAFANAVTPTPLD